MALHQIEQFILDVYRSKERKEAYLADRGSYLRRYRLSDQERSAILEADAAGLYDMGVHPMLLMYFARVHNLNREYLQIARSGAEGKT